MGGGEEGGKYKTAVKYHDDKNSQTKIDVTAVAPFTACSKSYKSAGRLTGFIMLASEKNTADRRSIRTIGTQLFMLKTLDCSEFSEIPK